MTTVSVNIYRNPIEPSKREQRGAMAGTTLRRLTIEANGGAGEWPFPTVAVVNGEAWKRGRWNEPLSAGMVVEFRSMMAGDGGRKAANYAWIGAQTAVAGGFILGGMGLSLLGGMGQMAGVPGSGRLTDWGSKLQKFGSFGRLGGLPETPGNPSSLDTESGSPTYSIDGQGNRKRVGEAIPVIYGKMRVFPDMIQDSYARFGTDNRQTVSFVGLIGHGEFSLEGGDGAPRFGSGGVQPAGSSVWILTDLTTFSDAYAFMMPVHFTTVNGEKLTTSYVDYDIKSGYTGTGEYKYIDFDIVFPNGLYSVTVSGNMDVRSNDIDYSFKEYLGASDWAIASGTVTASSASGDLRTQIRRTFTIDVSAHTFDATRYIQASVKRDTAETVDFDLCEESHVYGVRGMRKLPITPDTYTYALYALTADENINGDIASKFNVTVTRALPIWDGDEWSAMTTTTRSIAWALADICRNTVYGMGLDDSLIDLDTLLALDAVWTDRGDYFDGVFDQTVTAWEALQKVARCGRAIPLLVNGKVTFVRDGEKTIRSAIFNPSNILPDSLSIQYSFRQESEPDGIDLSYLNTTTWENEIITLALPGVVGDPVRPQKVELFGCTDPDQALREATYLVRRMAYVRKTISWQTELDGRLLMVGDMVAVAHDMPGWSQSGEVIGTASFGGGAGLDVDTSEPLDWSAVGTKYVMLKKPDGTVSGPHTVTEITGGFRMADPGWTLEPTLENGDRTTFIFYTADPIDVVITDISPSGDTTVTITGIPYDARIHATGA